VINAAQRSENFHPGLRKRTAPEVRIRSGAEIVLVRGKHGTEPPQAIDPQSAIGRSGLTLRRPLSFQYGAHLSRIVVHFPGSGSPMFTQGLAKLYNVF
jgi:hypothetical protein